MLFSGLVPLGEAVLERAVVGYSALLLGFFSGARFGRFLLPGEESKRGLGLILALLALGLAAVLLPFTIAIALLIVGFGGQGAWDSWSGFKGTLPRAYAAARRMMTWAVCLTLMAVLVLHGLANA